MHSYKIFTHKWVSYIIMWA